MSIEAVLTRLNTALLARRGAVLVLTAMILGLCGWLLATARPSEDISVMLPGKGTSIAKDFALLKQAPLGKRLTITVSAPDGNAAVEAAALADGLKAPYFTHVLSGPPPRMMAARAELAVLLPGLATEEDLLGLEKRFAPDAVRSSVQKAKSVLLSPQGPVFERLLRRDPLDLGALVLQKLGGMLPAAKLRVQDGRFVNRDGDKALIIASSDIPMTDAKGCKELVYRFDAAAAKALSDDATASLVGGHRYTHANASAVKRDLAVILPLSAAALACILIFGIRSRGALAVMAVPGAAFCVAGALTDRLNGGVSGIVLGFGGVLLGIAVDFALHVFFALRQRTAAPGSVLAAVARPMLYGALTSCVALASLLLSDIPGIRQLSIFAIIGIVTALGLSLSILPLILPGPRAAKRTLVRCKAPSRRRRVVVLGAWMLGMGLSITLGSQMHFNADLRALGYVPDDLARDEAQVREIWGGMRDYAMIFAERATLDQALAANDAVSDTLHANCSEVFGLSLAAVLPSAKRQQDNLDRWNLFVDGHADATLSTLDGEAERQGFSPSAFAPFRQFLSVSPESVTPARLASMGGSFIVDLLLDQRAGATSVMTLVPDSPKLEALFNEETQARLGARLVSGSRFRRELQQAMVQDVTRFGLTALALVGLLVLALFRDLRQTVAALVPVVSGLAALAAALWAGGGMNLFHVVSVPLIIGLGADYGIFMTCRCRESLDLGTGRAVVISGLTTLAGLGALAMADHPALHSIGLTVLVGIGAAMATSLMVTPVLARGHR